ncbi:MAG: NAD(P)-dependent oxidoreductase [Gammaproteobacteria bacterium]|nr:MAG: NAD(P)-dependent oxidoreductase [Gammaproteobacteria bacterium]
MKNYLKNKNIFISGATSGIGEKLAMDLIDYDVNLILVARNYKKLENLKQSLGKKTNNKISIFKLDVRHKKNVTTTIAQILEKQPIDILINNAGLALGIAKIYAGDMDNWDNMIDTNIKGLLYVSRPIIKHMVAKSNENDKNNCSHIINLGSVAGKISYPGGNVYCATKAAVHSITDSMNADLFATNIKVTTIAPGAVETNFSKIRFKGDDKKADGVYDGFQPLVAEDISNVIINTINTPPHVNIQYIDIMPTAQRNPYLLDKNNIK